MTLRIFKNWLFSLLIVAPGLLLAKEGAPAKSEFKKEINKEFSVGMQDKLVLSNRYGKVDVKTWDQAKVTIDVTITVNARKESDAQEVFDRIKIEMNQNGGMVSAKTEIEDKSSWSDWLWGGSSSDFKIDYLVRMPAAHHLDLSNKYGHSYVEDFAGDGDMNIKYGDLFAGDIGGDFNLYLGYGNATVGNVKGVTGEVKYSKLKLEKCDDMRMEIKYSKLTLESATSLKLTSGYDDLNLGTIGTLTAYAKYSDLAMISVNSCDVEAKYTDVRIEKLSESGVFNLGYGGINIDNIGANFSRIGITAKYAGIKLHPSANSAYSLSADVHYASVNYPDGMKVVRDIDSGSNHEFSGYYKSESGGKIKVSSSYGSVKVY